MNETLKTIAPKAKKAALVFRAINNKTRQTIINYLLQNPDTGVTKLYVQLRLEQSVASQHLGILRREGIVKARREGKNIFYSVDAKRLHEIDRVVDQLLNN